jgi:hypothetical protein
VKATGSTIRGDYDSESQHQIAAYLVALGAIALLFFAAHWRSVLRILDPGGRMGNVALTGATVASAGFLTGAMIHAALAEAANKATVADPALQALNALDNWSFYVFGPSMAAFMLASGLALLRGRPLLPRWLAWAAVVIGVAGLIPFVGFFAFLLTGIWVLVVSLMLFTRWEGVHAQAGQGAPAAARPGPGPD